MKKLTLQFLTLPELGSFAKLLGGGHLLNTTNLTITAPIPEVHINLALELYNAKIIETTEKVFAYAMRR